MGNYCGRSHAVAELSYLLLLGLFLCCGSSSLRSVATLPPPPPPPPSSSAPWRRIFSPDTDALQYNLGKTATPRTGHCLNKPVGACPLVTVNRTLTDRLADQISVLDFGATAGCHGDTEAGCQHDSTQAFLDAILYAGGEDSSPFNFQTIVVPPGWYRIDGTITIEGQWLVIQKGARLLRKSFATNNTAPIIRLAGTHGRVTGGGVLSSENSSPRGVINIGPTNLSQYSNVYVLVPSKM